MLYYGNTYRPWVVTFRGAIERDAGSLRDHQGYLQDRDPVTRAGGILVKNHHGHEQLNGGNAGDGDTTITDN